LFKKTYATKQKRKKSRFLDFEKKMLKNAKVMASKVLDAIQSVFPL